MLKGYLKPHIKLHASITRHGSLAGSISNDSSLSGSLQKQEALYGRVLINTEYSDYVGSYKITPTIKGSVLNTSDKHMVNDVDILGIPYYEVSDDFGKTIIIGEN